MLVALVVAGVQMGRLLADWLGLTWGVWGWLRGLALGSVGLLLVAPFAAVWVASWGGWKRLWPYVETSARIS
jgi:high-affinity nickel permease